MTVRPIRSLLIAGVLGVAAFGYSVLELRLAIAESTTLATAMVAGTLETLSSPTFVAFVLMTGWLVYCLVDVRVTRYAPRLIRVGSYGGLAIDVLARSARATLFPAVGVIVGAALPSLFAESGNTGATAHLGIGAANVMLAAGVAPGVGLVLQLALLLLFVVVVRLLIEMVAVIAGYGAAVVLCVAMWLWGAASASGLVQLASTLDLRSYVFVAAFITHPPIAAATAVAYAAVAAGIMFSAAILDASARGRLPRLPVSVLVGAAAFLLILAAMAVQGAGRADFPTALATVFFGPSGTIINMLVELALLVGYVFVFQFRVNQQLGPWGTQTLIRYGSRATQILVIARDELFRIFGFCAVMVASALLAYLLVGGRDFAGPGGLLGPLLFQLSVVQALQLFFYICCVLAAVLIIDSPIAGLVVTGVLAGLSAIPNLATSHLPIQASAAAVVYDGGWPPALVNAAILIAATVIALTLALVNARIREALGHQAIKTGASVG